MTPPRESSREDRLELHREKMRNKAARRKKWNVDRNTPAALAQLRRWYPGSLAGRPHKDAREIARRVRQQKRRHDTYMMNGGFTRRGNEAGPVL